MDDALRDMLIRHEGKRLLPYVDTVGKLTIGVGRNLTDVGISDEEAEEMLANDAARALANLMAALPNIEVHDWSQNRLNALTDMMFNLGPGHFAQFQHMIAAINAGDWAEAAKQMRDSLWAQQVGSRATELADLVENG